MQNSTSHTGFFFLEIRKTLLLMMTASTHWAALASTAAGGLPFPLIPHKMYNDRRHNYNQNKADQNGSYIFRKPCQHLNLLLWQNTEWAGLFYANPLRKLF